MKILHVTLVVLAAAVIGYVVIGSQEPRTAPSGEHGMDHSSADQAPPEQPTADNPAVKACQEANAQMHEGMSAPATGDADRDFASAMIAHHQGAIDMAHILLQYGRDPELRAMAEDVVEVQQGEIEFLQRWLTEHPE